MSTDRQTLSRIDAIEAAVGLATDGTPPESVESIDRPTVLAICVGLLAALAGGVESVESGYNRAELDAIATAAGIDAPDKLPTKRVVAEHIYDTLNA